MDVSFVTFTEAHEETYQNVPCKRHGQGQEAGTERDRTQGQIETVTIIMLKGLWVYGGVRRAPKIGGGGTREATEVSWVPLEGLLGFLLKAPLGQCPNTEAHEETYQSIRLTQRAFEWTCAATNYLEEPI